MKQKTKEIIKDFLNKEHLIPPRLWREILWLQDDRKLGITRDKRFFWIDKTGKHEGNLQNFFRKNKGHWKDHQILERLKDYQLFFKLDTLTAREIINCKNVEIRSLLMRRFGIDKLFRELGGFVEHQDGSSQLIVVNLGKNMDPMKLVKVRDATTKEFYVLAVPHSVHTCKEAIAWTFGLTIEEYNPIKET
ncbi:MAG: hypothetical protein HWN67_01055 [Candidatus Helarchaeota archaeon]|nr:hypothetical protein [Candidatus Helarchaeota archaeon]